MTVAELVKELQGLEQDHKIAYAYVAYKGRKKKNKKK